jgi:hypothetical protein
MHLEDYIKFDGQTYVEEEKKVDDGKRGYPFDDDSSSSSAFEDFSWFKADGITQTKREKDTFLAFYNDYRQTIQNGD